MPTREPIAARVSAKLTATVDLPTPPLPPSTARTWRRGPSPRPPRKTRPPLRISTSTFGGACVFKWAYSRFSRSRGTSSAPRTTTSQFSSTVTEAISDWPQHRARVFVAVEADDKMNRSPRGESRERGRQGFGRSAVVGPIEDDRRIARNNLEPAGPAQARQSTPDCPVVGGRAHQSRGG